jgi:hypothetical protein
MCVWTSAQRVRKIRAAAFVKKRPNSRAKWPKKIPRFLAPWPKNSLRVCSRSTKSSLVWRKIAKSFGKLAPRLERVPQNVKNSFSRATPQNSRGLTVSHETVAQWPDRSSAAHRLLAGGVAAYYNPQCGICGRLQPELLKCHCPPKWPAVLGPPFRGQRAIKL